jgi:hypothetical protein
MVDATRDQDGHPILWVALDPMLFKLADGSEHAILPAGAEAVSVQCVVPGRGGPNWFQLVAEVIRPGQVQYEE